MVEHPVLFPDDLPPIVQRIWDVVLHKHYAGATHQTPTRQAIANLLLEHYRDQACSLASVNRAFHTYPHLLPWPIRRGQLPPWIEEPKPEAVVDCEPLRLMAFGDDGQPCIVEAVVDKRTGVPRIITHAVAAGFAMVPLLDALDGVTDHVIHWCRILVGALHQINF